MAGYIGGRARKRKRNIIIFFVLMIFLALGIYAISAFKLTETLPSDSLLPSDEEITSPKIKSTIEDLELKVFDKEQKIVFRNKQIENLKKELKILVKENELLSQSILDLNNQLNSTVNNNEKVEDINQQISQIKKDTKKELQKLNNLIKKITIEKTTLLENFNKSDSKNNSLRKENKIVVSKNIKSNILKDKLENQIKEMEYIIEEQKLLIKVLQDTSHHL